VPLRDVAFIVGAVMMGAQHLMPGVLELDLNAVDTIAGVICGARVWALHEGDAGDLSLPPECADAVIMDPPGGISFMGAKWDGNKGGRDAWVDYWAARLKVAFDALKPGAHALVWSLPRTSHWTALALEKAGFVIRDTIDHVSGAGFPKSLDIGKAIDAALGAKRWAGWGTALRPNKEVWWLAQKPRTKGLTIAANVLRHGVGGLNIGAARVGDPGLNAIEEALGIFEHMGRWPSNITFQHSSWDESECRACGVVAPFGVRFCPACGSGDVDAKRGGCRCVGERRVRSGNFAGGDPRISEVYGEDNRPRPPGGHADADGLETIESWACLATCERCGESANVLSGGYAGRCPCGAARRWACAVALLDEQSGSRSSGAFNGEGGASRFFNVFPPEPEEPFFYSAKPSTRERESGLDALPKRTGGELTGRADGSAGTRSPRAGAGRQSAGRANHHPTVKGFHLIGHFCDLLVPPGGLVLDLTAGSGTLGAVVAHRHQATGWRCIMAELDSEHCRIIRARCKHWGARPWRPRVKRSASKAKAPDTTAQADLFAATEGR